MITKVLIITGVVIVIYLGVKAFQLWKVLDEFSAGHETKLPYEENW